MSIQVMLCFSINGILLLNLYGQVFIAPFRGAIISRELYILLELVAACGEVFDFPLNTPQLLSDLEGYCKNVDFTYYNKKKKIENSGILAKINLFAPESNTRRRRHNMFNCRGSCSNLCLCSPVGSETR